jgi:hypothetical protein
VNRPGMPSPSPGGTSQGGGGGGLRRAQVAAIKMGEEIAWRGTETRRVQAQKEARKKGDHTCGQIQVKQTGDNMAPLGEMEWRDGDGVRAEDVAHADRYFDMYINAEAWGGN